MDKPKIKVNGKTYEMQEAKAKAWRMVAEFDENKKDIPNVEFIEKHAEIIAQFFPKLTVEEILENMSIPEVIKTFYDCYKFMSATMYSKLQVLDSTEGGEEAKA